jgi:hypothetical protein
MSAQRVSLFSQFSVFFSPRELEIQPVKGHNQPLTLLEICKRIRVHKYRCPECSALVGGHVKGSPHRHGVKVHPLPELYLLSVPCPWCKTETGLTELINANTGRPGQ